MKEKFIVWRRDDGYINATCNYFPYGCGFEILLETEDWEEAKALIIKQRELDHKKVLSIN